MLEIHFRRRLASSLKTARAERGLTQRELSKRARMTEKYLSRVELGLVTPSALVVFRLAAALDVEVGQLASLPPSTSENPMLAAINRLLRRQRAARLDRARRIRVELFR